MPFFTHNGHHLHYRQQGDDATRPLLLILPGNTATSACHLGELAYFGARFRAVSLDFWGTGQSDRMAEWPDDWYAQGAHDAAALVAHLGETRTLIVGTSGGATVGLWMAVLHPEVVTAVIADSTVAVYPPDQLHAGMNEREQRTPGQVAFWQHAQGEDWTQVIDADSAMLHQLADRGGRMAPEALATVGCPVLLTATLSDPLLPEVAHQLPDMARQIPDARVYLTKGGDHPLMWSKPEEFRRVADLFLEQVASA